MAKTQQRKIIETNKIQCGFDSNGRNWKAYKSMLQLIKLLKLNKKINSNVTFCSLDFWLWFNILNRDLNFRYHKIAWNPALPKLLKFTPAQAQNILWVSQVPESKFEANRSRGSWVMIGQTKKTDIQTDTQRLELYKL